MTWPLVVLAWAVAYVILAILVGILLGIRRTLDDVKAETEAIRVTLEEMYNRPAALPEMEHHGTVAMETNLR